MCRGIAQFGSRVRRCSVTVRIAAFDQPERWIFSLSPAPLTLLIGTAILCSARSRGREANVKVSSAALIATVSLGILVTPLAPEAQPTTKVFRIAELDPIPAPTEVVLAFRQRLGELGYVLGKNLLIEERYGAETDAQLRAYAADLVRLKVDVIFADSSAAVRAARQATTTIPIVALDLETDPVASGLVGSLARPGGNLTGLFLDLPELNGKLLQLLKEAIPGITRVAVLWDSAMDRVPLRATEVAARSLGLQLHIVEVRGPNEFERAFKEAISQRASAFIVMQSPLLYFHRAQIAELAIKQHLPTITIMPSFAEAGHLMSYGPNLLVLFQRAAIYVDKILKGAKPGDLPVERPTRFALIINLKTAKALGLTIPQSVLARADEVIR
jgi:putative ABC transport system substrate-binding protein